MSRRSLVAAASAVAALGWAGAAQAQSSVNLYGLLDMSVGQIQTIGSPDKVWRAESGRMATSFIGFKGKEDMGGGLNAIFAMESFLRVDTGENSRFGGDTFWSRSSWLGLQGAFGSTRLGRTTTTLFVSTLLFNAFADSFGYSPSIRQLFTPFTAASGPSLLPFYGDTGWNNSLIYTSPNLGGLTVSLQGNLGEGAAGAVGRNTGGHVLYFGGPFAGTVAVQQVKNGSGTTGAPAGFDSQDTVQVGASYDAKVVKVYGQYTMVKTKATADTETKIYGLGGAIPIGNGKVLLQYGNAKAQRPAPAADVTIKTTTVGYDYNLSKNTDLYAVFMNEKVTNLSAGRLVAGGLRLLF